MRWNVQLLGGFAAHNGDAAIAELPAAMLRLLARLLLEPDVAHSRDALAAWLWPHERPRKGRAAASPDRLRRSRLRRLVFDLLGRLQRPGLPQNSLLLARRATLQIRTAAFDTDVAAFERNLAAGDVEAARAALARGLLPDVDDPWLDECRLRLQARLHGSCTQHVSDDRPAGHAQPAAGDRTPPRVVVPYPTRFFGRDGDIERLGQMLSGHRLVVLSGPAGCGKSRLAARVAEALLAFDPVIIISLEGCVDPDQLAGHVRGSLGIPVGDKPAHDQLAVRLAGQRTLLLLDNFDLLVGPAGEAALEALLLKLPQAHALVTTRRELQRPGAPTLQLEPLPLPQPGDSVAEALRSPAVALFADRAKAACADFSVHRRNVADVVQACLLLDGLPLAIEIAASHVRLHPPADIAAALRRGLALLRVPGRPARPDQRAGRHASLQAALQWSWGQLGRRARAGLAELAMLRGQWTEAHAQAMTGARHVGPLLASLQRDSLLFEATDAGGQARMGMLHSVREFVLEQASRPRMAALRLRHRLYFDSLGAAGQAARLPPSDADLPDHLAAIASALTDGDVTMATRHACWIGQYLSSRGASPEALEQLLRTVHAVPAATAGMLTLRGVVARLLFNGGRSAEALALAAQTLQLSAADGAARAEALYVQTHVLWLAGRDHAAALPQVHEALRLARDARARDTEARVLLLLGAVMLMQGCDAAEAARCFEASGHIFAELGDLRGAVQVLPGHVTCLMAQQQPEAALRMAADAESRAAALGLVAVQLQLMNRQSECQGELGRLEHAVATCRRQVRVARAGGMAYHLLYGLWNQCLPLARLSQLPVAAQLMGFSRRHWREQFGGLDDADRTYVDRVRRRVVARLGSARWRQLFEQGERMSPAEAARLGSD